MKKIILGLAILNSAFCLSQELKTVLNEEFNNNINDWNLSKTASISNGMFKIYNHKSFCATPGITNPKFKDKEYYEIETNFKVNLLENSSAAGIIFINELQSFPVGYLAIILKRDSGYYIYLNKNDFTGYAYTKKLENFDPNAIHNFKIKIDNSKPKVTVFVDSKNMMEGDFPLFNFENIGFYGVSNQEMIINDIKVKVSTTNNTTFLYDISDKVYDKSKNELITIRGDHYSKELMQYVPKAILFDDYEGDFDRFKKELMTDEKCENFKTVPSADGLDLFVCTYQSNKIMSLTDKKHLTGALITFSKPNSAIEFYNLYSKAKKYKIESDRAYSEFNSMKAILLNKAENSVTIFL